MKPLIICALPRSRTFWLYKYFSLYDNIRCEHEYTAKVDRVEDYFSAMYSQEKQFINVDAFSFLSFPFDVISKANVVFIEKDISRCVKSTLEIFPKDHWVHQKGFKYLYTWYEDMQEVYKEQVEYVIQYEELDEKLPILHELIDQEYNSNHHKTMLEKKLNTSIQYISFQKYNMWQQSYNEHKIYT